MLPDHPFPPEASLAASLDGIRVLEVANWLAAPAATALMADLGAGGGELGQLVANGVLG